MMKSIVSLCYLGIICLTCFPASTFSQTNGQRWPDTTSTEKKSNGPCRFNQFECKSGMCVNPFNLCDGSKDCDDGSDETIEACSSSVCPTSAFRCEYGACVDKNEVCDGISNCADASDENPMICAGRPASSTSKTSLTQECGKFDQKPVPLQRDPISREGSRLPWFAAIYKKNNAGSFSYICSGSVVSSYAVVTGAVCVYDAARMKSYDPSLFRVFVGRYNMNNGSPNEQQLDVKEVHIPPRYRGVERNFASDIAVLLVKNEIVFNSIVQPICLDLEGMYSNYLSPGKSGIVGSWGGNARYMNGTLRIHSTPYVSLQDCEEHIPPAFMAFITSDKFCSGIINASTICRGDSGAGFATQFRDKKWYLTGLVSVGASSEDDCNTQNYYALTRVSQHYDFLEQYINETTFGGSGSPQLEPDTPENADDIRPHVPPSTSPPPFPSRPPAYPVPTRPYPRPQSTPRPSPDQKPSKIPLPPPHSSGLDYCTPNFMCKSGECVDSSVVCNGVKDCRDGSDEDNQRCGTGNSTLSCCYSPSGTCKLPEQPEHGYYTIVGCQALGITQNPGNMIPVGVALMYVCDPGYVLSGSSVMVCNNDWTSDPPTCSKILCPPLNDPSRDIYCVLNGDDVDCKGPAEPGTRATLSCKTYFENVPTLSTYDIVCERHGKWSREVYSCVPKCGEPNPHGITLIGFGKRTKRSEYPWHVGLYKYQKDGSLSLHCSGTLVSSRVIVTAAHCFPEDTAKNMENVMSQYQAVAGKYYRVWNVTSKYTQHLDIEGVVIHKRYRGENRNHVHDIAVIILKYQVRIDEAVRPVCVDFDKSFLRYFSPGISGTVLGWGWTENQTWSDVILTASLPYVSQVECEEKTPSTFHNFLIGDKFCAGKDKTVVCQGDSGGGYAVRFPHSSRWFLTGVVSIGATEECAVYPYAAFTNIYDNLEFVRQYVDKYI